MVPARAGTPRSRAGCLQSLLVSESGTHAPRQAPFARCIAPPCRASLARNGICSLATSGRTSIARLDRGCRHGRIVVKKKRKRALERERALAIASIASSALEGVFSLPRFCHRCAPSVARSSRTPAVQRENREQRERKRVGLICWSCALHRPIARSPDRSIE